MKFNATARSVQGSSASRRLRRAGRVPAIVYGGTAAPEYRTRPQRDLPRPAQEEFHASILQMALEGAAKESKSCCVRFNGTPTSRKSCTWTSSAWTPTRPCTKVPLHFLNAEVSPAVKLSGAIISHVLTELEITCLPAALPQFIEIDLKDLLPGASVHLADIKLPKGVTYVPHGGEPNPLLAAAVVRAALPPLTTPPKPLRPPKPGREPSGLRKADAETLRVHLHAQGFGLNTPSCLLPYASSSGWAIPAPTTKPPGTTPASGWPITWPTICARPSLEKSFFGMVAKARLGADNVLLLKPNTYMNRSGQAVGALARFYKLAPEAVLVLHDELDLMPGQVKLKQGGGHA